jgi:hypothetical protein
LLTDGRDGSGRDVLTGTDNDDQFIGLVGQNSQGAVANAFSTGDYIDGGAGRDRIEATMINDNEVFGEGDSAPRPITKNVEEVYIEAIEPAFENVTLDVTRMEGVEEFWSNFSRSDMTFTGVNLRGSNLNITKDVTFGIKDTMHDTDFTALFDSLSLTREAASQSNSQLLVRIADVSTETPEAPLTNVNLNLSFDLGEDTITLENIQSTDGSYAGLVTAIKNALALEGYANLTVELSTPYTDVTFAGNTVNLPFTAQEILITDPAGNEFDNINFTQSAIQPVVGGFLVAGNASAVPPGASSNLIESNLVLDNAGNGSTAGDVLIGGMSNSDLGVERFNVLVDRDSKISSLNTTTDGQNASTTVLQEIHIGSLEAEGDLWIGATQANLNEIDANAFAGQNLSLGEGTDISNLTFLDASGTSANITFKADYNGDNRASADQGFVINTGSGNDNITAVVDGTSTSLSTLTSLTVNSTGGNNVVTLSDADDAGQVGKADEVNTATVTLGAGTDIVTGGGLSLTANTGAGNDVIYAENTGTKARAVSIAYDQSTNDLATTSASGVPTYAVPDYELLAGRDIRVTLAIPGVADEFVNGFETVVKVNGTPGSLSTLADYNNAVLKAINEHPVLQHIAEATVDSNNVITVEYKVDGLFTAADDAVKIEVLGNIGDVLTSGTQQTNLLNALKEKYSDSGITAGSLEAAYNGVADSAITVGATVGSDSTTEGLNIINAGTGNDVIVLSSAVADQDTANAGLDARFDTVKFDAGNFGNDTIVHFGAGADGDVLDFTAWLDSTYSFSGSSGSTSLQRVDTTVEFDDTIDAVSAGAGRNVVSIIDFADLDVPAGVTVANFSDLTSLSSTNLATLLNNTFDTSAANANATKHIFLIENVADANLETANLGNIGQYAVVQAETSASSADLVNVTLVGTLDFGNIANAGFDASNFA